MKEIMEQNIDIQKSIEFLAQKYDELTQKVGSLENENKHQLEYINSLESKIDILERNSKATTVEIRNIPLNQKETKDDLLKIVQEAGNLINLPIEKKISVMSIE
ncbi:unnamed protein product [Parnassius apollo]|uniref:(apollo) hypothetical protein n=1 Tax=Parnassius apollo TaxID=110799 RepID=A0A8S3XL22_PARAO|nr:unnamed protein product [Parnassius apollo]